jgi:5-methylcytosine-specific restriction endonuclease McrA
MSRKQINLKTPEGRQLFYQSPEWRAMRELVLSKHPYCKECLKDGVYELASECDHIIDIKDDVTKFMDKDNLQGLCKRHHSAKTFKGHTSFQKPKYEVKNLKWKINTTSGNKTFLKNDI